MFLVVPYIVSPVKYFLSNDLGYLATSITSYTVTISRCPCKLSCMRQSLACFLSLVKHFISYDLGHLRLANWHASCYSTRRANTVSFPYTSVKVSVTVLFKLTLTS